MAIFLIECIADVYDNDLNLIIGAETELQAKEIAKKRLSPQHVKEYQITNLSEKDKSRPLHEYSPHAGDPNLGW